MRHLVLWMLILLPSLSHAADGYGLMQVSGTVALKGSFGRKVLLTDGRVWTDLSYVNPVLHPIAWYYGTRQLRIDASNGTVYIRIPKLSYNDGQVSVVNPTDLGQNSKLTSTLSTTQYSKSEDLVENYHCTYSIMMSVPQISCDPKGMCTTSISLQPQYFDGSQRAQVRFESWVEQLDIKILTDTGSATVTGEPQQKAKETVLQELTSCS